MILKAFSQFHYIFNFRLIFQTNDPYPVIVLEDLTMRHYETLSVQLPTYEESKIVFQRLAKFHAATYYLLKEQVLSFTNFFKSLTYLHKYCRA